MSTKKLTKVLFALFSVVTTILFIDFVLKLVGAPESVRFVNFWHQLSEFFIIPFRDIYSNYFLVSNAYVDLSLVVAFFAYLTLGGYVQLIVDKNFLPSGRFRMIFIVFNAFMSIIQLAFGLTFTFKLIGASADAWIVNTAFSLSTLLKTPFLGLVNDYQLGNIFIDFTSLVVLVIIGFVDMQVNNLIRALTEKEKEEEREILPNHARFN